MVYVFVFSANAFGAVYENLNGEQHTGNTNPPHCRTDHNAFTEKELAGTWYKKVLSKATDKAGYIAQSAKNLNNGGCFCLSGLVQGLLPELQTWLHHSKVPYTVLWGAKNHLHRNTNSNAILGHFLIYDFVGMPP